MEYGWYEMLVKAIAAGFLMAAMVWLLPSANAAPVHVVTLMTYLIAAGGFMHIVAGSMEAFMLLIHHDATLMFMTTHFFLPTLTGDIIGGTALFALLSYAQVMKEI